MTQATGDHRVLKHLSLDKEVSDNAALECPYPALASQLGDFY